MTHAAASLEDAPIVRWTVTAIAVGLAFGSGVAVLASYLVDRIRRR